jgi:biopolymer transport protein ExbD
MPNKPRKKMNKARELDMIPFVNFMISIIPALIVSVEFAKISIIDMKLPEGRGSQTEQTVKDRSMKDEENKLLLTAVITDSVVTLGAKNGFLPSLFYKEFHHYVARDDNTDFTVEYKPGVVVRHPKTGREMTVHERYDIWLYVTDENRSIQYSMYSKRGELITDGQGIPVTEVHAGDTVFALTNPRRMVIIKNPSEFRLDSLSAYDELRNRLMKVKERFRDVDDPEDIIIAAENEVFYDKIVQIMDAAKMADFPNISIAKLRG